MSATTNQGGSEESRLPVVHYGGIVHPLSGELEPKYCPGCGGCVINGKVGCDVCGGSRGIEPLMEVQGFNARNRSTRGMFTKN